MPTYEETLQLLDKETFETAEQWNIHSENYEKKEVVRQNLLLNFPDKAKVEFYDYEDTAGYRGWISMPDFGAVAFLPTDGSESTFRW